MTQCIGFIGLGLMGAPMAKQFIQAGFELVVYDRDAKRMQSLVQEGARAMLSPQAVADIATIVISSVPNAEASLAVTLGEGGVNKGQAIRYYIETSTIGVRAAREISAALATDNITFIDAPVSGGPRAIEQRQLTAMIAASAKAIATLNPVLHAMCKRLFVVGAEPGLAQACKLVNNAIGLSILQIAAEATVFGVKAGLDPATMIDVINASSGQSAVTMTKFPTSILTRRFDYGASLATGAKDMRVFLEEAQALGLLLESTPAIAASWKAAADGNEERDFTEIIRRFEDIAGVEVGYAHPSPTDLSPTPN